MLHSDFIIIIAESNMAFIELLHNLILRYYICECVVGSLTRAGVLCT